MGRKSIKIALSVFIVALSPLASVRAAEVTVVEFCKTLPDYVDTGAAAYREGVDAKGRAVAPADIGLRFGGNMDFIEIPVEYNLLRDFNLSPPSGVRLRPDVAFFQVHRDGHVSYNGQDVTAQVAVLCNPARGQGRADALKKPYEQSQ